MKWIKTSKQYPKDEIDVLIFNGDYALIAHRENDEWVLSNGIKIENNYVILWCPIILPKNEEIKQ